jgi:hypothetical protein
MRLPVILVRSPIFTKLVTDVRVKGSRPLNRKVMAMVLFMSVKAGCKFRLFLLRNMTPEELSTRKIKTPLIRT